MRWPFPGYPVRVPDQLPRDPSVRIDADVDGLDDLRQALEAVAPPRVLRFVLQRLVLVDSGRPAGIHDVVDAILDGGGNLLSLSLRDAIAADPATAVQVESARGRVDAWLDAHDAAARESTEIVLDADGGHEVRVAFDLDVAPGARGGHPTHPALHDGTYHVTHRAPDLDALRDRVLAAQERPLPRWMRRVRSAITRRD